jgi:hypothetical protein
MAKLSKSELEIEIKMIRQEAQKALEFAEKNWENGKGSSRIVGFMEESMRDIIRMVNDLNIG